MPPTRRRLDRPVRYDSSFVSVQERLPPDPTILIVIVRVVGLAAIARVDVLDRHHPVPEHIGTVITPDAITQIAIVPGTIVQNILTVITRADHLHHDHPEVDPARP